MVLLCLRLLKSGQALHQAALAAGNVVFVKNAFFGSLIERFDGLSGEFAGSVQVALIHSLAGFLDEGTGASPEITVTQTPLFVLAQTFGLRFDVRQGTPSNLRKRF